MIRSFNGRTPKLAASAFVSEVAYVIGAGSLVDTVTKIPEKSVAIGIPARVKSEFPPDRMDWLEYVTRLYAEYAQNYKRQGL